MINSVDSQWFIIQGLSHGLSSQHHHDWIWLNSQDIQDIPRLINSCHGIDSLCQATCSPHELDYGGSKHHESGWAEDSIHGEGLKYPEISNRWQRLPWNANFLCSCFMLNFGKCTASWATTPARAGPWRHHFAAPSGGGLKICRESGNGSASSSQIWPRAAGSIHSPGVQGFDTLPYKSRHDCVCVSYPLLTSDFLATFARHFCTRMCQSQVFLTSRQKPESKVSQQNHNEYITASHRFFVSEFKRLRVLYASMISGLKQPMPHARRQCMKQNNLLPQSLNVIPNRTYLL